MAVSGLAEEVDDDGCDVLAGAGETRRRIRRRRRGRRETCRRRALVRAASSSRRASRFHRRSARPRRGWILRRRGSGIAGGLEVVVGRLLGPVGSQADFDGLGFVVEQVGECLAELVGDGRRNADGVALGQDALGVAAHPDVLVLQRFDELQVAELLQVEVGGVSWGRVCLFRYRCRRRARCGRGRGRGRGRGCSGSRGTCRTSP